VATAASYFALPSTMITGISSAGQLSVIRIETTAQAEVANASLPCGALFIAATQHGRFVNALFRLTGRPGPGGSDCGSGAGETARTNFLIEHGRIVQWIRALDEPGDNATPANPVPAPQPTPGGAPMV
jgi:hypothetical protein